MKKIARSRQFLRRAFPICCLPIILLASCTASKSSAGGGADYWPADTWRTSSPEKQGLNSRTLGRIDEYVQKDFTGTTSALVVRHGFIVFEKYYRGGPGDPHLQYSVTKSVVSALVGIAMGQGLIGSVNDESYRYLPEAIRDAMTDRARTVTVHHLLTMTSGFDHNDGIGVNEPKELALWFSKGLVFTPGTLFAYNGNNSNLLSAMITETSGLRASAFARKHLFDPIGIRDVVWDERGAYTVGYTGLRLKTRDMARLGYLYLRRGRWNGRQVVPESWVDASTKTQTPIQEMYQTPGIDDAYGYAWWTMKYGAHPAFSAIGYAGQRICVIPDLDLVIVLTGSGGGEVEQLPIIRDCILASITT
jgi:CubicO group peptidase (beta-lactamase class C family)